MEDDTDMKEANFETDRVHCNNSDKERLMRHARLTAVPNTPRDYMRFKKKGVAGVENSASAKRIRVWPTSGEEAVQRKRTSGREATWSEFATIAHPVEKLT